MIDTALQVVLYAIGAVFGVTALALLWLALNVLWDAWEDTREDRK
jgi:hypothetical protein